MYRILKPNDNQRAKTAHLFTRCHDFSFDTFRYFNIATFIRRHFLQLSTEKAKQVGIIAISPLCNPFAFNRKIVYDFSFVTYSMWLKNERKIERLPHFRMTFFILNLVHSMMCNARKFKVFLFQLRQQS